MKYYIYKIYSINNNIKDCYIGSTNKFSSRKSQHKKNTTNKTKKSYHRRLYRFIRENGGWDNFIMEIVEEIETDSKGEALLIEQYYIDTIHPILNRNRSTVL